MEWGFTLAGLLVGIIIGLTGIGGGSLMTPIALLFFGVAPGVAIGTNLWFATATKVIGSLQVHVLGAVDWQVVRRLWLGSLPACAIVILFLRDTSSALHNDKTLMFALGVALLLAALAMLLKNFLHRFGTSQRLQTPTAFKRIQPVLTVLAGAFIGVFVTLTSVGAGTLCAAMLIYLYPLRMQPNTLVGTDIVHAVPLTLLAGFGHFTLGHTDFGMLGYQLLGSIPGILLGARLAHRLPDSLVRTGISVMLALVALKFVF